MKSTNSVNQNIFSNLRDISERKIYEEALINIAKGVSANVGEKFFYSLAEHLSSVLNADYAYIATMIKGKPNHVKTISLIADGNIVENIEVNLANTPCETILEKNICTYPSGVPQKFPKAMMMAQMKVEGYAGKLLYSSSKEKLGLMAVMYRKPIENVAIVESMLRIFASRAAAELERELSEGVLRKANEEIEILNRELEKRVEEKTTELFKSQAQLVQSEKLSAMGRMSSGLAHELNSPLAGLLPMIEQYRDSAEEGSEAHHELTLMLKACKYMARIVKDFGVFSRESKGDFTELQLNEVIEDTLSFSAVKLRYNGIKLIKEYGNSLSSIFCDKTEIQQVILNIITNACDAMPEGGELIIKTGMSSHEEEVIIEFIDNGAGIQKNHIDKLFDPFFTTKRPGEGTGLGLSVSYGIIKKHGGEIIVERLPNKGTKFKVILPVFDKNKVS